MFIISFLLKCFLSKPYIFLFFTYNLKFYPNYNNNCVITKKNSICLLLKVYVIRETKLYSRETTFLMHNRGNKGQFDTNSSKNVSTEILLVPTTGNYTFC